MVAIVLLAQVLFASAAFAAPSKNSRLAERVARRSGGATRQSVPVNIVKTKLIVEDNAVATASNSSHTTYSGNWAGAVYENYPEGSFTAVAATFTVPSPSVPSGGGSDDYSSTAWVGIDGATCGTAILQTGVDFSVSSSGAVRYNGWYEWYPERSFDFTDITFNAGDTVTIAVFSTSKTSGAVAIENKTNGQKVYKTLTSSTPLCQQNAEWIIEEFQVNGQMVPFANFGTIAFNDASAVTSSGSRIGPDGAEIFEIKQGDNLLTSTSTSSSSVTIRHV